MAEYLKSPVAAPSVSVVIPAFNEEGGVGQQVKSIQDVLSRDGITHEIIVVDDGSQDRTAEEAINAGGRVLRHLRNRGYGASLKTGILAAKYEAIAIIDADGTYPADQIPVMLTFLETADMIVGTRTGEQVNIPWVRKLGKLMLGLLANQVAGQRIPDLNSGLRVFWRQCVVQYFPVLANKFSFTTTMTLALMSDDYRVLYHPINYYQRIGKSKIVPRHFLDFIILVLRMAMLFQPLRVFIPIICVTGLMGLIKLGFDITATINRHNGISWKLVFEPTLSTSAVLLLLVTFQLLLVGMVADGIIRRIAQHNQPGATSHAVAAFEMAGEPVFNDKQTG